jgi:N-acetylmuramoyl-L-alanine amidase
VTAGAPRQLRWRWLLAVIAAVTLSQATVPLAVDLSTLPLAEERLPLIVLDPGRGGSDQGAQGPTGLLEKDLTLQVASEAGRLIGELLGWRVVLTRSDDSAVALETRGAVANQAAGDLYISIHAGGSFAPIRRDFQLFYFEEWPGPILASRQSPGEAERSPRSSARQERDSGLPKPVLWDQAQLEFIDMSQTFARMLYRNLRAQVGEEGRGVFGLPILPLRWVRMPAVLVDLGSPNDPQFATKVHDEAYLQRVALGIAQAVNDYQVLQR